MKIALIVSTYNQPQHLARCLYSLTRQTHRQFELVLADDGSDQRTREVVENFRRAHRMELTHVWQEDRGFRKTRVLNQAILATDAEYLVFTDGDCLLHPDFIREHARAARPGHYLNGALIRLGQEVSEHITPESIASGEAFNPACLSGQGRWDRRYLRLSLGYPLRRWLNHASPTSLYFLGANSSCYRKDALAVNGFDHRFSYGFEDGDFGHRLENAGVQAATVRWTAIALHLHHERPWSSPEVLAANRKLQTPRGRGQAVWAREGIAELLAGLLEHERKAG